MPDKSDNQDQNWLGGELDDDLQWLNGAQPDADDPDAPDVDLSNWLAQVDKGSSVADKIEWPDNLGETSDDEEADDDSVPDWLHELGPNYGQPESMTGAQLADDEDDFMQPPAAVTAPLSGETDTGPLGSTATTKNLGDDVGTGMLGSAADTKTFGSDDEDSPGAVSTKIFGSDTGSLGGIPSTAPYGTSAVTAPIGTSGPVPPPDWIKSIKPEPEEEAQQDAEFVDWLDLGKSEPETSGAAAEPANLNWMNALEDDDDPTSGFPDWLNEPPTNISGSQPTAVPAAPGAELEWLGESDDELEPASPGLADWLPEAVAGSASAAQTTDDDFDWVDSLGDDTGDEQTEQPETVSDDWLKSLRQDVIAQQPVDDGFNWPPQETQQPVQAATADDMPDWLRTVAAQPEEDDEVAAPASVPTAAVSAPAPDDDFEWLTDLAAAESRPTTSTSEMNKLPALDATDIDNETVNVPMAAQPDDTWMEDEFDQAGVTSHEPAENAPDWLNAMVPGVDLDYTPAEDEPVETFDSAPAQSSPTQEFDWLMDIVDEETQPADTMPEPAAAGMVAAPSGREPRFMFSKPPMWLRSRGASNGGLSAR